MEFDVIVVGAGHAGIEAALSCAKLGNKTAIFTVLADNIGAMSCNPSIGGPAKSHLVREVDALGGVMGKMADRTYLQKRILNTRKGPAVRSTRMQIDRHLYQQEMKKLLEHTHNLSIVQSIVSGIIVEEGRVLGVTSEEGEIYRAKAVIIATGTFMRGRIHIGKKQLSGGRFGEISSENLSLSLEHHGLQLGRFKTGTPARLDGRTIDYSKMAEQKGDLGLNIRFSYDRVVDSEIEQMSCFIAHTNSTVHNVITDNIHRAPMYNGQIESVGPRYCPSIEDKIMRYPDKDQHHIFVEPEGRGTVEMYPNGISTSLPAEVQLEMIRAISGLENAKVMRYGYAIEYDIVVPQELKYSLETRKIENLFLAGQINGTSGYEEAASQGLMAGINASLKLMGKEPLILDRGNSYIGTLIDDLVSKGTNEPYRMFTARSEYRLILREDNADLRLMEKGYEVGLISKKRYEMLLGKKIEIEKILIQLETLAVVPSTPGLINLIAEKNSSEVKSKIVLREFIKRPEITLFDIRPMFDELKNIDEEVLYQVEVMVKYEGYIKKQERDLVRFGQLEGKLIPADIEYSEILSLPREAVEKLKSVKPQNIGQASRISGITPAAVNVILLYLKGRNR
ncbi:MAG: tRNA uridine-5-carboxymethylaminomethyl(34) synthesis enzyme MnmG [Fusobacteria bacterium]|nr:tRNA uridine-5-carboxymethylaminomethyl(34) synthesis enzyme MnmG [Fusobacteriota bacterium]